MQPLCDIWQSALNSKMKIAPLIILVALLASCEQNSKQETSIPHSSAKETNNNGLINSIIITDNDYVLNLNGVKDTFETVAQLGNTLEKVKRQVGEDTMYVYMKSTIADRMVDISPMLRKININKYQYIITEDAFALPYPKDTKKVEQQ